MGRVVPFRASLRVARPPAKGRAPWDASLVIAQGAMRTPTGFARCQGRLLLRHLPEADDGWELTFRDAVCGVTRTVEGTSLTPVDAVIDELLMGMFRQRLLLRLES